MAAAAQVGGMQWRQINQMVPFRNCTHTCGYFGMLPVVAGGLPVCSSGTEAGE